MVHTMAAGVRADRDAIHRELWQNRNRRDLVEIHQGRFAAHLGITGPSLCRILKEFTETGRIKKTGSRYRNVGVYQVFDPETYTGLTSP